MYIIIKTLYINNTILQNLYIDNPILQNLLNVYYLIVAVKQEKHKH